jgi:hypothetical protein
LPAVSVMSLVLIECPKTHRHISTGVQISADDFDRLDEATQSSVRCPRCGKEHHWTKRDAILDNILDFCSLTAASGTGSAQRCPGPPICPSLGHGRSGRCFVEHRAGGARHGVMLYSRRKGEIIGRVDMILKHAEVPRWHGKTVVETSLTAAGDMYESAIEHGYSRLANVKSSEQHGLD